jgi:hypothetical protein
VFCYIAVAIRHNGQAPSHLLHLSDLGIGDFIWRKSLRFPVFEQTQQPIGEIIYGIGTLLALPFHRKVDCESQPFEFKR